MEHSQTKEKILRFIRTRGPSIPVQIGKEINNSILFTSAFLSELLSEKEIKTSYLRVGSSPVYFIPGQESQLEKYANNITGKEKEAFQLLKDNKFLEDEKQQPAIRVALRAIKDFAIPFQKNNKVYWRYFTIPEDRFELPSSPKQVSQPTTLQSQTKISPPKSPLQTTIQPTSISDSTIKKSFSLPESQQSDLRAISRDSLTTKTSEVGSCEPVVKQPLVSEASLDIFDNQKISEENKPKKEQPKRLVKKSTHKKPPKKKISEKKNEKFFDKVKEFLSERNIEISGIEGFNKNDLTLRIKENGEEKFLIAYNKKRLTEIDIVNAHKKAKEQNLKYIILSLGEPLKKTTTLIEALRDLDKIEKIE